MRYSWGSMLRTIRAAVAVMLLGGVALIVPPQTQDMLVFLDNDHIWAPISFQIALIVLGGSAWFWSRAALAARFGIDDGQRSGAANLDFNWTVFTWLPRLMLIGTFLVGALIAYMGRSPWTIAGAIVLGAVAVALLKYRPSGRPVILPPVPRGGFSAWFRGGARARLSALLQRAPFGKRPATTLLVLGLVPLALGVLGAFTSVLRLPNHLAAVFPGPGIAVLLLGLMIGPLVMTTFVCDGLTLQFQLKSLRLGLRRPPVLSLLLLYVFVLVPACAYVHTVRLVNSAPAQRTSLKDVFDQWVTACAPRTGPAQPIIVAVSGGATRAGLWGAAVMDRVMKAQLQDGPALFAVSSVSGGSLGVR
jgi:hypothetical protein